MSHQVLIEPGCVGVVETQYFHYDGVLKLESGRELGPLTLAYETYGTLNAAKDNALLIVHALSGDAHVAGWHAEDFEKEKAEPGWWDMMVGPGKAFDTDRYYLVCANVIGGCMGSTGPQSPIPPPGSRMPPIFP